MSSQTCALFHCVGCQRQRMSLRITCPRYIKKGTMCIGALSLGRKLQTWHQSVSEHHLSCTRCIVWDGAYVAIAEREIDIQMKATKEKIRKEESGGVITVSVTTTRPPRKDT